MSDSILGTIKQKLGGMDETYTAFDQDIVTSINTALMIATQIGVGPDSGFFVTGETDTWEDWLGADESRLEAIKDYIYLRVRLLFDPPSNSFLVASIEKQLDMLEWRLNIRAEEENSV